MEEIFEISKESITGSEKDSNPAAPEDDAESTSTQTDNKQNVFAKFRAIVNGYLNGEAIYPPSQLVQNVLSSFSLAAYLDHAIPTLKSKEVIITELLKECCFSLQELLRVTDGICYVHEEPATAVIQLIQMQLLNLYPKYSTQGYEALYSCPPTIYISPLCIPSLGNIICRKLGLPSNCVKVMKMTGQDLSKLEKSLQEDLAAKRVPLMIIASSGSHHTGQVDNLAAVSRLSQRFSTWLHLEGLLITHLSLSDQPQKILQVADSLHLDLRHLLGIPSLPYITMYRNCEIALQRAVCLRPSNCSPFTVVPLWFALQSFETSEICKRFQSAIELSSAFITHLVTSPNIKILSHVPKMIKSPSIGSNKSFGLQDLATDGNRSPKESSGEAEAVGSTDGTTELVAEKEEQADTSDPFQETVTFGNDYDEDEDLSEAKTGEKTKPEILMNAVVPIVVFQYRPKSKEIEECTAIVLDDLNLWLAQVLTRAFEDVHIDIIDVDEIGFAVRFSPYEGKSFPSTETLQQFFESFDQQLEILNATVMHKSTLIRMMDSSEELQLVKLPGWAGLGGVRYLPSAWRSSHVEQLPDQGKEEINKINKELVARLKLADSAFSIGIGEDGLCCVRFGMVVAVTDVPALISLVRQTGLDLEASTLALETMAVMVRKGIEEAQAELQRETEQKLWQEGLLRHIPVVGSLFNYFSPPPKMPIKGRTMNLQDGRIEKSDVVLHLPVDPPAETSAASGTEVENKVLNGGEHVLPEQEAQEAQ